MKSGGRPRVALDSLPIIVDNKTSRSRNPTGTGCGWMGRPADRLMQTGAVAEDAGPTRRLALQRYRGENPTALRAPALVPSHHARPKQRCHRQREGLVGHLAG
jgi:hypothetical protein